MTWTIPTFQTDWLAGAVIKPTWCRVLSLTSRFYHWQSRLYHWLLVNCCCPLTPVTLYDSKKRENGTSLGWLTIKYISNAGKRLIMRLTKHRWRWPQKQFSVSSPCPQHVPPTSPCSIRVPLQSLDYRSPPFTAWHESLFLAGHESLFLPWPQSTFLAFSPAFQPLPNSTYEQIFKPYGKCLQFITCRPVFSQQKSHKPEVFQNS